MSKPKLLITMGCSFTEGEGCYDPNDMPTDININRDNFTDLYLELTQEIKKKNYKRFHENGWPNRLGKKLNYDRVINLGLGGSSTSGQLKVFIEKYHNEYFKDYDVLLFWYLSEPARISFYQDNIVNNIMHLPPNALMDEYLKSIDIDHDTTLEQLFYVRLMNEICSNRNWYFLIQHHDLPMEQRLRQYDSNHGYYLNQDNINIDDMISSDRDYYQSIICSHPNENGYELIATILFSQIKKFHPDLINHNEVKNFRWEWNGLPKRWEKFEYNA